MKVIIPAGGYATRLYPLTENMPKALLKVGNKLMLEHIIDKACELKEVDHIYVVSNNKFFDQFEKWQKTFTSEIPVTILNNGTMEDGKKLGPWGEVEFAMKEADIDDDLLVLASDNLFDLDLSEFIAFNKVKDCSSLALYDLHDVEKVRNKFGVVLVDDDLMITGFEEKPDKPNSTLAATMIYYVKKDDAKLITPFIKNDPRYQGDIQAGDFWIHLLNNDKKPHGFIFDGEWFDIGGHDELKFVNEIYSKK